MRRKFVGLGAVGKLFALALVVLASASAAQAQGRIPVERLGGSLVKIKVGELTLESIDFRDQTARLSLGLDVSNGLLPVTLKDFDYSLRLNGQDAIEGTYAGQLRIGGRNASRVNLPVTVHLRSIPGTVWSAFRNRGRVAYDLETGFTLPLYVTERRFDQSFSGEVPLRTLVDAASILRASRMTDPRASRDDGRYSPGNIWPF
ncbi:MAG TPA: LEA type 2 family protein [Pyrinomonadaceae bacterium]|nr:LEA type 2 family protein [Pyrinomonadaceae bacterium]